MPKRYDADDLRRARIGALLITVIVTVCMAVFFVDTVIRLSTEGPLLTVTAAAAPGVEPGTAVWVAGRSVGRVTSVQFREPEDGRDRIVIVAILERGIESLIRSDAVVSLQPGALLEPVVVFVNPGDADLPWDFAEPLHARDETLGPEALLEMGDVLMTSSEELSRQAARVGAAISRGGGTLAALKEDPSLLRAAGAKLNEVRTMLSEDYPNGSIGRLAADTLIALRLSRIRDRLATLDSLSTRDQAARSYEETSAALAAFQDRLAALSTRLDAGEGTAGRALRDGELARQVALLRARLDSTAVEFAKYPDRWLRVRVF